MVSSQYDYINREPASVIIPNENGQGYTGHFEFNPSLKDELKGKVNSYTDLYNQQKNLQTPEILQNARKSFYEMLRQYEEKMPTTDNPFHLQIPIDKQLRDSIKQDIKNIKNKKGEYSI